MSAIQQSARGASVFTQPDDFLAPSMSEAGTPFSACAETPAGNWSPLIDELLHIRTLEDDWDGEGTEAPAPALVDRAITLAQCLQAKGIPPASRVIAGINGTIYFEWHTPLGYQEIEVTSPNDVECRWVRKGSNAAEVVNLSRCS